MFDGLSTWWRFFGPTDLYRKTLASILDYQLHGWRLMFTPKIGDDSHFDYIIYIYIFVLIYFSIGLKPPPTSSKSFFLRPKFCFLWTEKPWMTPAIATLRSIHPLRHRTRRGLHVTAPSTGRWGLYGIYGKPKGPGSLKEVHLRKKHLGILVWIVWFGLCLRDYVSQVFFYRSHEFRIPIKRRVQWKVAGQQALFFNTQRLSGF